MAWDFSTIYTRDYFVEKSSGSVDGKGIALLALFTEENYCPEE
jgi:hypothetical protein